MKRTRIAGINIGAMAFIHFYLLLFILVEINCSSIDSCSSRQLIAFRYTLCLINFNFKLDYKNLTWSSFRVHVVRNLRLLYLLGRTILCAWRCEWGNCVLNVRSSGAYVCVFGLVSTFRIGHFTVVVFYFLGWCKWFCQWKKIAFLTCNIKVQLNPNISCNSDALFVHWLHYLIVRIWKSKWH